MITSQRRSTAELQQLRSGLAMKGILVMSLNV
jgi:hypothetical protein